MKNVALNYPEFIPDIVDAALILRKDKMFHGWTAHESQAYKDFISTLEKGHYDIKNKH